MNYLKQHKRLLLVPLAIGVLWSWLWIVNLAHITDQASVAYIIICFTYLLIVGIASLVYITAIRYLQQRYWRRATWVWLLEAVAVWAFAEALVAWLVAFVWMGTNGSVDNVFPFTSLTPFIMFTPLKFLARFVGYYGLSAILIIGVTAIIAPKLRKYAAYYWLIVILATFGAFKLYQQPQGVPVKATVVAETLDNKQVVQPGDSSLIVLPEYGLDKPIDPDAPPRVLPTDRNYYFVGSRQTTVTNGHTNVLIFGSKQAGETNFQPKNRLIAGGEYLPYGVDALTKTFLPNTNTDFQVRRSVVRGSKPIYAFRATPDLVVGAGVCSSIMTPRDYRELTKQGSSVLTNSASLEIFEGSRLFGWQHRGLATFMAVANARPFLQSTNQWPAFILNQDGLVQAEAQPVSQTQATVMTNTRKTLYTYLGDWLADLGLVIIVLAVIKNRKNLSRLLARGKHKQVH